MDRAVNEDVALFFFVAVAKRRSGFGLVHDEAQHLATYELYLDHFSWRS